MAAYELLARFKPDGTIAGVSVRNRTTVNGKDYEGDPEPLSGTTDPAYSQFKTDFAAAVVIERDALLAQVATLTTERDDAVSQVVPLQARIAELESQLDDILNPPGPDLSTVEGAKQFIAVERFNRESGGIIVGTQSVTTNRDEMPIWLGMVMDIIFNPDARTLFEYKPRNGSNTVLSAEQVMRCYQCFAWYVSECFAAERRLATELDKGAPIADVLSQIPAIWPQNVFEWTPPV